MRANGILNTVESLWTRHRRWLLPALLTLMSIAAILKLEYQFRRLVWVKGPNGAVDLVMHLPWVVGWFSGEPVYQQYGADYPPASLVMLWPFMGWLSVMSARWLWAATSVAALAVMIFFAVRISGAKENWERWFAASLLLSLSGTAVTIGNGQLILHILPALLAAVLILNRERNTWGDDLLVAGLLTWSMVKPSVTAPFLWVFLFGWNRWRPVLLSLIMYSFLTLLAACFREEGLPALLEMFLRNASMTVLESAGTRNIHALMTDLGWTEWISLASILIFAGFGVWAFCYRYADRWVLVAVAALVARMWTYHRVYDDVLILMPELVLLRIARQSTSANQRIVAGTLVGLCAIAMLCPGWLLEEPGKRAWIWNTGHAILWLLVLACLMDYARRDDRRSMVIPAQ